MIKTNLLLFLVFLFVHSSSSFDQRQATVGIESDNVLSVRYAISEINASIFVYSQNEEKKSDSCCRVERQEQKTISSLENVN